MKVLITGGGTGGHIYPAIAIAKKLKKSFKNIDILYVGTENGLEKDLVPKAGLNFKTITVTGFKRRLSLDNLKTIKKLFIGLNNAREIINTFKPDLVIGTGGYVCGPIVLVAALKNIKTVIHEQNVVPGMTNKILGKFVNKILISYEETKEYFSNKDKVFHTGNPVREEFLAINSLKCKKEMKVSQDSLVILSFGGSRGAKKINDTILNMIKYINGISDITLIHVTGNLYYEQMMESIKDLNIKLESNIKILPYIHNMPKVMGASDLIIARSGAITLAEITTVGLPSILVPSPNVVNNHQEYNARVLEKQGAAIVLLEKDFNSKNLYDLIVKLKGDRERLVNMACNSKSLSMADATKDIMNNIEELLNNK